LKLYEHGFFIGISLIFIISLFCITTISANPITVTAKPSAINDLAYVDYTMTWENHCPLCGHNGTLTFNPKGTYEGELTCSYCDADYCAVTGKDKHGKGPRACLPLFKYQNHSNNGTYFYEYNNTNSNNDYLNSNMSITEENNMNISDLENLILNGLNLNMYSQFRATLLESRI